MHTRHIHHFNEAADMGDAFVELAVEVKDLIGQAEAQMIWRKHMIVLRQNRQIVLPGGFRTAAEFRRVKKQDAWALALMRFTCLEIVRHHTIDGNRPALHVTSRFSFRLIQPRRADRAAWCAPDL